jgi:hypothetical protein
MKTLRFFIRVVQKLQFRNNFRLKMHVSQPAGRETAKTVREPTGFPNKSILGAAIPKSDLLENHTATGRPSRINYSRDFTSKETLIKS